MDVQATPSPYAALDTTKPLAGNPPALGQQVPGHTGGLPAQAGLSVLANPMAEALRSKGRGEDTMLVHMTPAEVNSLQGLAMAHGGSLTINPETGLPEAGWLGKLLPTILGAVGMAFGIPPIWMGAAGAVGGTLATGDLGKGLAMGLQAFGGASMAGGLGLNGAISKNAFGLMGSAGSGMPQAAGSLASSTAQKAVTSKLPSAMDQYANLGANIPGAPTVAGGAVPSGMGLPSAMDKFANLGGSGIPGAPAFSGVVTPAINAAGKTGLAGFMQGFGDSAKMGLPGGIISKAAPMLAAQGVMSGVSNAMTPTVKTAQEQTDNSYAGPYMAQRRTATFAPDTQSLLDSTKERRYFDVDMPEIYNVQGQLVQPGSSTAPGTPILQNVLAPDITKKGGFLGLGTKTVKNANKYTQQWVPYMQEQGAGYAEGGEVELADGAFVVDARTVSELGNGSSGAGQELLAKMGGRPIRGPGDGVSDSIPARIGRDQPARVARDEVLFTPEAVRKVGKGNEKRGAQKLYALMDKAHDARRKSARGKDTGLRKGLA